MFNQDTLAILELQYLAIENLFDRYQRMPSRDEVIVEIASLVDSGTARGRALVQ